MTRTRGKGNWNEYFSCLTWIVNVSEDALWYFSSRVQILLAVTHISQVSSVVRSIEDQLSAKHQLAVKGLSECRVSESNIRLQVKDIVKEVEDYLKTYSSAGTDISWHRSAVSISCQDKFACKLDSSIKFTCSKDIELGLSIGTGTGSLSNSNVNRVDTMPNTETTNTSPSINVSRSVDDDLLLPQLLNSRG
uniref:Uncharacterized protein n=1 Tax=Tanacetum cinerariifolium TaxID=118510 RepID=A0A6L2NRP7_TANCI|nr:hypothetical protein [Tanacetum cinerariifolium]